jgi:hypothetical protein
VVALLLVGSAVATSLLLAAAARLPSLAPTLLVAYLAFTANLGLVTLALSPFQWVTRGGLAVAEALLLAGAAVLWWRRGRPGLPLASARGAARVVLASPVTAAFLALVAVVLAYELVLVLTVPPNNGDSLAYHLSRAAAWAQHGGFHWIPNAPTIRMNGFQPLAEQQILFFFVATGRGALFALPQYLAQLAILVAVYGAARRLGFDVRAAAGAMFLVATFSVVALEASTAQNDLVAASFPAVAVCLLLGRTRLEHALGGVAVGMGLGVKLTAALVVPFLAWLALARGRRVLWTALAGGVAGLLAVGIWGYVLNLAETGDPLGEGTGPVQGRTSPAYPDSVETAIYIVYSLLDVSVLPDWAIWALAAAGVATAAWLLRRRADRGEAVGVATPFLAPLLVLGAAAVVAFVAERWGFPIDGPGSISEEGRFRPLDRIANANYSAFGPVGIVALLAATVLAVVAYVRRRAGAAQLALACAFPAFVLAMSLQIAWNPFLIRFLVVPAVLTAPLLAHLFRGLATTTAYCAVAGLVVVLTLTHDQGKPFDPASGKPWGVSQVGALEMNRNPYQRDIAASYDAFRRAVPDDACVGAVVDNYEPSFLLFGPDLGRRVVYLTTEGPYERAIRNGLWHVVVTTGVNRHVADRFAEAGWRVQPIGDYWLLASAPGPDPGTCRA